MSLLAEIRARSIEARKARKTIEASLLTTLLAEAAAVGKNARNGESTDAEVYATVKKFLKNNEETRAALTKAGQTDTPATHKADTERMILLDYLRGQLSEDELGTTIDGILDELGDRSAKAMGAVMAKLKERHEGLYDGKLASTLVRQKLA